MTLAAARGSQIRLEVDGVDEEAAISALSDLVSRRFGEAE
jgi:phosphocarrier protein HPr